MKTCDEMLHDLYERRDAYAATRAEKRKKTARIAAPTLAACLIAAVGIGVWQTGAWKPVPVSPTEPGTAVSAPSMNDRGEKQTPSVDKSKVIWANDPVSESALTTWENKTVGISLLEAMEQGGENSIYAIAATPQANMQFEYQGKTVSQYQADIEQNVRKVIVLDQLVKEGDALKYGESLYETGTPEGEKWGKPLYEERIAYYGRDLLDRYIANGEFDKAKAEEDLKEAQRCRDESVKAYESARKAHLSACAAMLPEEFSAEVDAHYIVIYLTKDSFAAFMPDLIGEHETWTFALAAKGPHDETQATNA